MVGCGYMGLFSYELSQMLFVFLSFSEVCVVDLVLLSLGSYLTSVLSHYQIPGFCVGGSSIPGIQNHVNCDVIVGYKSVYRMCFAMGCFFFLFSIIMIRVRSSKDPRAALQNGFVELALCSDGSLWSTNMGRTPPRNGFVQL